MFESLFPSHWTTLKKLMWLKLKGASAVWSTVTGNPVSFTSKAAPLRQLSVAFSPVQEGSGDPSPDNVRPIIGWDSLNVWQTNGNIIDPVRFADSDNWIIDSTNQNYRLYPIYVGAGNKVTFLATITEAIGRNIIIRTLVDSTSGQSVLYSANAEAGDYTKTVTATGDYLYLRLHTSDMGGTNPSYVQAVFGESTDKIPYNGRSISITLGSTVYSGTVDVVTGVGEIDKVLIALTGTERYQYRNAEAGIIQAFWKPVDNIHPTIVTTAPVISNMFASSTSWDAASGTMSVKNSGTDSYFNFRNTAVFPANNIDGVKAKVAELYANGTPVTAIATLATPIPFQLTPQEVESLLGDNVMWSDANGNLTVEYRSN